MNLKILSREQLVREAERLHLAGRRIVVTNGCFDLLHVGHVRFLQASRKLADVLIVGINSDSSVKSLKGPERPIVPESERAEIIAALEAVDYVSIFSETTAEEFLRSVKPNVYVKGGDYRVDQVPEVPAAEALGAQVKIIEPTVGHSTSDLLAKIKSSAV